MTAQMDVVRHMQLARAGQEAEIALFAFPYSAVLSARRAQQEKPNSTNAVAADPVALLSSNIEIHVALLLELFAEFLVDS
jgi:hypothetical protein